jgi:geranylgeranyl diphosphate synthase type II
MLIEAIEKASGETKESLDYWLNAKEFDNVEKVKAVTAIYNALGIKQLAEAKINAYFDKGLECLAKLKVEDERKTELKAFAEMLIDREV